MDVDDAAAHLREADSVSGSLNLDFDGSGSLISAVSVEMDFGIISSPMSCMVVGCEVRRPGGRP